MFAEYVEKKECGMLQHLVWYSLNNTSVTCEINAVTRIKLYESAAMISRMGCVLSKLISNGSDTIPAASKRTFRIRKSMLSYVLMFCNQKLRTTLASTLKMHKSKCKQ